MSTSNKSASGRGSISGWALCPLCPSSTRPGTTKTVKKYALGRGIASHLRAVHTPWNLGRMEIKRREAECIRAFNLLHRIKNKDKKKPRNHDNDMEGNVGYKELEMELKIIRTRWEPTLKEVEEWNAKVLELTAQVEAEAVMAMSTNNEQDNEKETSTFNIINDDERNFTKKDCGDANVHSTEGSVEHSNNKKKKRKISVNEATTTGGRKHHTITPAGHDRFGNKSKTYRDSLPPFIKAAADGDIDTLYKLINQFMVGTDTPTAWSTDMEYSVIAHDSNKSGKVLELLDTRDRNNSTAEHWAAGGGHLSCLKLITELREKYSSRCFGSERSSSVTDHNNGEKDNDDAVAFSNDKKAITVNNIAEKGKTKKLRKRDGKTALHYAARNGHNHCIDYILRISHQSYPSLSSPSPSSSLDVDEPSGDGTTPLHMACYGGHFSTVKHLITRYNANINAANDWECSVSHWVAMCVNPNVTEVIALCNYLKHDCNVRFHTRQKQGHSSLHKAAQRRNKHIIEWLYRTEDEDGAGLTEKERWEIARVDEGGNKPSDIWFSVGGDEQFGHWMRDVCGW